jgi:hypothetical protein
MKGYFLEMIGSIGFDFLLQIEFTSSPQGLNSIMHHCPQEAKVPSFHLELLIKCCY